MLSGNGVLSLHLTAKFSPYALTWENLETLPEKKTVYPHELSTSFPCLLALLFPLFTAALSFIHFIVYDHRWQLF